MGASIYLCALAQQYRQSGEQNGKAASCLSWKVVRVIRLPRASAALALLRPRLAWNTAEQCQGFPRVDFLSGKISSRSRTTWVEHRTHMEAADYMTAAAAGYSPQTVLVQAQATPEAACPRRLRSGKMTYSGDRQRDGHLDHWYSDCSPALHPFIRDDVVVATVPLQRSARSGPCLRASLHLVRCVCTCVTTQK